MSREWRSIFDSSWPAQSEDYYSNDDYATWAYGFRFTEYDKGILASCGISWR